MKFISKYSLAALVVMVTIMFGGITDKSVNALTEWKQSYADEFEGSQLDTANWNIFSRTGYVNANLLYSPSNISVANGYLTITTQRHCVNDPSVDPDASNIHDGACPAGQTTKYSSGRIQSNAFVDGSKPFKVEIKAKIDWNNTIGTRPALWMVNGVTLGYCDRGDNKLLGELDILEWYARNPNDSYSTSHMTCSKGAADKATTRSFLHRETKTQPIANEWHTWTVEYDGNTIRYLLDGSPVNVISKNINGTIHQTPNYGFIENSADLGLTSQEMQNIMNHNWLIIINDLIEATAGPDATASFSAQHFLIDYVRVSTEAPQTSQNPQESDTKQPQTSTNINSQGIKQNESEKNEQQQLVPTGTSSYVIITTGIIMIVFGIASVKLYLDAK